MFSINKLQIDFRWFFFSGVFSTGVYCLATTLLGLLRPGSTCYYHHFLSFFTVHWKLLASFFYYNYRASSYLKSTKGFVIIINSHLKLIFFWWSWKCSFLSCLWNFKLFVVLDKKIRVFTVNDFYSNPTKMIIWTLYDFEDWSISKWQSLNTIKENKKVY